MKNHIVNLTIVSKHQPSANLPKIINSSGLSPGDIVLHRSGAVVQITKRYSEDRMGGLIYSGILGTYFGLFDIKDFVCVLGEHDVTFEYNVNRRELTSRMIAKMRVRFE